MYSSAYLYTLCDHRAFVSPESCSKVLSAAGKPRNRPLRQSRPYQLRACFLYRLVLRVGPFLRWPAIKRFSSTHRFQLGKILSPPHLGNARSGPSPSRWPALITKFPLVWLCSLPPASSSTPLRLSVYYFLDEALLVNLVKVS